MPLTKVNNIQIYYELHGAENKPVVLFLHGLGSSLRDWEPQKAYFMQSYRVLLVDVRGHGRSEKPRGPYTMSQFAHDVIGLLDQLKIDKVHLVGLSMGGMIAFQMAVDFPQRLVSMTIVNSGPAVVAKTLKEKFGVWMRFVIVRLMGMRKMGETLAPRLFVDADQEALRQTFISRWAENDPGAYLDALQAIVGWTVLDRIHTITVPTLIISSDQDYTPVSAKEAYISKMSGASLKIIENAHHAVSIERPEPFNDVVAAFLRAQ
jgi:3-oxoadipate enol-lactonase